MTLGYVIRRLKALAETLDLLECDVMYVSEAILGLSKAEMILQPDYPIADNDLDSILSAVKRLTANEPPQYITGKAPFFNLELSVAPGVLIPRPETEGLVELVLQRLETANRVLDIGTGSGAIAIAIKSLHPALVVDAIDVSHMALKVAKLNAAASKTEVNFYLGNVFPENQQLYDVIVSNPPYISAAGMKKLGARVKHFEPWEALFGGEDGLVIYRILLAEGAKHLNPSGFMALEHGATQRAAIIEIAKQSGWGKIEAFEDLQGRDRYLLMYLQIKE
ncbi:MAG: peptide chain release factor N(5)-glutamine methyltransferase [Candidatus Cloacimonetes bacterium]|nr:peptide chain release factor N(5)-glutamine methyltransferase [Candidatus Cloacimonadota bacterium]